MSRSVVSLGLGIPDEPDPLPDDGVPGPISVLGGPAPSRPGGLALSATLHVVVIALLVDIAIAHAPAAPHSALSTAKRADAVFLPPPAAVRKMLGLPPRRVPPPPAETQKDRISIGALPAVKPNEPLELHRDEDLTKVANGTPTGANAPQPVESLPPPRPTRDPGASAGEGGRLTAPHLGEPGPILASLQRLETSGLGNPGPLGVVTGTGGRSMPLDFDPQGADFTAWIQRFTNEVYRNWIVPPSAGLGWSGQVQFEFIVDRSGTMTVVRMLQPSGTGAYDRAAHNALVSSRLLPLPADYAPPTCTMRVTFVYNVREPQAGHGGR
jgi:TonB family protein